jgi:hypothetical protein
MPKAKDSPRQFRFVNTAEYLELPRDHQAWIIEPLLSPGAIMNIYGQPKAGKSLAGLGLAEAVSNPDITHWFKFPVRTHGPVLWLEVDNSPYEWLEVIKRCVHGEGRDYDMVWQADRELAPYPFDLLDEETDFAALLKDMIDEATEAIGMPPVLIVIDSIRTVHSGDEDKSQVMNNVLVKLQSVTYPMAMVIISHARKGGGIQITDAQPAAGDDGAEGDVMRGNRGSNAFAAQMQTVVRITTNRSRTCGYFTAEGRSIGQERFRIKQKPPGYLWHMALDALQEGARLLLESYPELVRAGKLNELARRLQKDVPDPDTGERIDFERAKSIIRRRPEYKRFKKDKE